MSAVEGGGPPVDWDALAPHIDHPLRRLIVEEIEKAGEPLSVRDLYARLGDSELSLSEVGYHANTLVTYEVLEEVAEQVTTAGVEPVYYFPPVP